MNISAPLSDTSNKANRNSATVGSIDVGQLNGEDASAYELISHAQSFLDVPYVYGGVDRNGLDCSSLMQSSFAMMGVNIPRTARAQFEASKRKATPEPGDLLFFDIKNNGNISHVGMYIGEGKMIHASTSRKKVKTADVNIKYWQTKLKGVGSFL